MTRSRARLSLLVAATLLFSPTFPNSALGQPVTFAPAATFGVGTHPQSVAVGDFNGDGKPDLAVANAGSDTVSVLLGNGDGTFQAARTVAAGSSPISVAVADFNGDGKPDLAVANYGSNTVSVLLGNGDGTFQTAQNFGASGSPAFVAVGDFNSDGMQDLALPNYGSTTVSVRINTTASQAVTLLSLTVNPSSVTGGSSSTATVTLSGPAPSGGALVSLSSNNTSVATVPPSVAVPDGGTSATFPVSTRPV